VCLPVCHRSVAISTPPRHRDDTINHLVGADLRVCPTVIANAANSTPDCHREERSDVAISTISRQPDLDPRKGASG